jgi:PKD repeat protein
MRRLGTLLLLVSLAAASPAPAQQRIINGTVAGSYPSMAFVQTDFGNYRLNCGGSLVAARWVLTAGHCITDPSGNTANIASPGTVIRVGLGKSNRAELQDPADFYKANFVVRHPDYQVPGSSPPRGDLALIRLERPAPFAQLPVLRPADAGQLQPGRMAIVLGWGVTESGTSSNGLREAAMPLLSDEDCKVLTGVDLNHTLCAGGAGRDTCSGDSGGPLMLDLPGLALAGVVSAGDPGCDPSIPSAFARVTSPIMGAFIASRLPVPDFTAPADAQPAQALTFTSTSVNPDTPYTTFRWDFDGDGQFGDATGASVTRTLPPGLTTVALEASNDAGDREVRRRPVDVQPRTAVAWTSTSLTVDEGRPIALALRKAGTGTGSVSVLMSPAPLRRSVETTPLAAPLPWAPDEASKTVALATTRDFEPGPDQTFTFALSSPTDALLLGAARLLTVTVDGSEDRRTGLRGASRTFKAQDRRVRVRLPMYFATAGSHLLTLRDSASRLLGSRRLTVGRGIATVSLPLSRLGASRVRAKGKLTGTLRVLRLRGGTTAAELRTYPGIVVRR